MNGKKEKRQMIETAFLGIIFVCWVVLLIMSGCPELFVRIEPPPKKQDRDENAKSQRLDIFV